VYKMELHGLKPVTSLMKYLSTIMRRRRIFSEIPQASRNFERISAHLRYGIEHGLSRESMNQGAAILAISVIIFSASACTTVEKAKNQQVQTGDDYALWNRRLADKEIEINQLKEMLKNKNLEVQQYRDSLEKQQAELQELKNQLHLK